MIELTSMALCEHYFIFHPVGRIFVEGEHNAAAEFLRYQATNLIPSAEFTNHKGVCYYYPKVGCFHFTDCKFSIKKYAESAAKAIKLDIVNRYYVSRCVR